MARNRKNKQMKTVVNFILDKSGSMSSVQDTTISAFNEYLQSLKNDKKTNYLFSLTLFDSESIDKLYVAANINDVKPLNKRTYQPNACTPLYDAVVETVEEAYKALESEKTPYASVVVIMTDGMENASTKHTQKCLADLRKKLEGTDKWTFVYMGANQDAWAVAQDWGFSQGNTMSFNADDAGIKTVMRGMGCATALYASTMNAGGAGGGGIKSIDNFFSNGKGGGDVKGGDFNVT